MRRTVKCLSETTSQLVDNFQASQEEQSKNTLMINMLASKVHEIQ